VIALFFRENRFLIARRVDDDMRVFRLSLKNVAGDDLKLGDLWGKGAFDEFLGEKLIVGIVKLAEIFLAEDALTMLDAFGFEKLLANPRAIGGRYRNADPFFTRFDRRPGVVEETGAAGGSGKEPEGSARGGDHRTNGFVEGIGDARSFIDEKERDAGKSADGVFIAGKADDAAVVREKQGEGVFAIATRFEACFDSQAGDFTDKLRALAIGGTDDDREAVLDEDRVVKGFDGSHSRLSPLAAAVENASRSSGGE